MKKWQRFMNDFCGSQQRSRPLFCSSPVLAPRGPQCSQQDLIDWSSSDEEAGGAKSNAPSNVSSSIVVRLDFDTVDPWATGLSKPSVTKVAVKQEDKSDHVTDERALSPILVRNARKSQVDDEDLFKSQEDLPASPILEVKRRKSPVLRRKRRNVSENLNAATPQKVQIIEEPPSPIISAHRRPERLHRRKTHVCNVETQPIMLVESPTKSPDIRNRSVASISPVPSPKVVWRKALNMDFEIVDASQAEECPGEQLIECPSSQDTKISAGLQIQSASSVSDTLPTSQNLHSDSSAKDLTGSIPPLDSAKKKRKPKKNGLLEKLQRLKNRQRSSCRIWLHLKQKGEKLTKGLTLQMSGVSSIGSSAVVSGTFTHNLKQIVIICDQEQVSKVNVKPSDFVTIYPPWQTFDAAWSGATIILSPSIFEKVEPPADFDLNKQGNKQEELKIKELSCQCSKDPSIHPSKCTTTLKESKELLDLLLMPNALIDGCMLRAVEELESSNQVIESQFLDFPIGDAVEVHAKSATAPLRLKLTCQKIFFSRRSTLVMSKGSQILEDVWTMLGNDSTGAFCFVELKGGLKSSFKEGDSYWLQGLSLHKRLDIARRSDVVSLISDLSPEWKSATHVFKFLAGRGCVLEKCSQVQPWLPQQFSQLKLALQDANIGCRQTVIMKYLAFESSNLYVTDLSASSEKIPYVVINIKQRTVIPELIPGTIIVIRDMLICRDTFTTDEFTSVFKAENLPFYKGSVASSWIEQAYLDRLKKVDVKIPNLSPQVENHQLVLVKGTICGVDEDNSCAWPVCSNCGGESLDDLPNDVMCCLDCHSEGPFSNKVALSVYISPSRGYNCSKDDSTKILIKLLQSASESILPLGWEENKTIGVEAVLGQEIGPFVCCVTCSDGSNSVSLCQVPF
ncbi:Hypothetical predicted protein [Cloeon dipterum]|uniref:DUF4503 domain-containing protein n=1 Tax=Cloeon dipterum TaxID=197152 RepID=A0A8S1CQT9_9INSE|nr:Hypothetical predicted protein [Cloeon dipterum]